MRVDGQTIEDVIWSGAITPCYGDRGDDLAERIRVVLVQRGDDYLGFGVDRGNQDVPVVRVGKVEHLG